MVRCDASAASSIGAGIILGADSNGLHVATADHVVRGCRGGDGARVRLRGRPDAEIATTVLPERDSILDLAVLRIDRGAAGVDAAMLPFDRLGHPDSVPYYAGSYHDESIAITFEDSRPWGFSRAYDLRTEEGDPEIRYTPGGVDPGRLVRDSIAAGHAGGALVTRGERLVVGMILLDRHPRDSYLGGRALRIDVLLQRVRDWGVPVNLRPPTVPETYSALAIGAAHMCGLSQGAAWCWGENDAGQLGNGTSSTRPSRVLGRLSFRSLFAGNDATCGLTVDGEVYCWGAGVPGLPADSPDSASVPLLVSREQRFESISLGMTHACGLTAEGAAWCWGANDQGQLGSPGDDSTSPRQVAGDHRFTAIASGGQHTCALSVDGEIWCWGDNTTGSVGNGSREPARQPAPVAGGRTFTSVTASWHGSTCAIATSGSAYCWGQNESGQLGIGWADLSRTPAAVAGGLEFALASAGDEQTCAIEVTGPAYCWGFNAWGKLGDGTDESHDTPVRVVTDERFVQLVPGRSDRESDLMCALTADDEPFCWGSPGGDGQAGTAFPQRGDANVPVRIRPSG